MRDINRRLDRIEHDLNIMPGEPTTIHVVRTLVETGEVIYDRVITLADGSRFITDRVDANEGRER